MCYCNSNTTLSFGLGFPDQYKLFTQEPPEKHDITFLLLAEISTQRKHFLSLKSIRTWTFHFSSDPKARTKLLQATDTGSILSASSWKYPISKWIFSSRTQEKKHLGFRWIWESSTDRIHDRYKSKPFDQLRETGAREEDPEAIGAQNASPLLFLSSKGSVCIRLHPNT